MTIASCVPVMRPGIRPPSPTTAAGPSRSPAERADPQARQQRNRRRCARFPGRPQDEPIDARIEITERAKTLAKLVDAASVWLPFRSRSCPGLSRQTSCPPRTRTARALDRRDARTVPTHHWLFDTAHAPAGRAPSTPLNDTNVVFFTSARTALPVSAGLPSTSSRSSMIWNASPRFLANADNAAMTSAFAPAVRAPAVAEARTARPSCHDESVRGSRS